MFAYINYILHVCRDARVVKQASTLLSALIFEHEGNKALLPARGALQVLLDRITLQATQLNANTTVESQADAACIASMSLTLASLLLFKPNHEIFYDINGLQRLIVLCTSTTSETVLQAYGMVLSSLVPCPTELYRYHIDEFNSPIERYKVIDILKRIRYIGFANESVLPTWLELPLRYLAMPDSELHGESEWIRKEYVHFMEFFIEVFVDVSPDLDTRTMAKHRGMLFTMY